MGGGGDGGVVDDAVLHLCMFAAVTRRDCLFRERFKFISNARLTAKYFRAVIGMRGMHLTV